MKTLIVAAILALTASLHAQTVEIPRAIPNAEEDVQVDEAYVTLLTTAFNITKLGRAWIEVCSDKPTAPQCVEAKTAIDKDIDDFATEAGTYKSTGDDCRAEIRARVIAYMVGELLYNKKYAGKTTSPDSTAADEKNHQSAIQLKADMDDCGKSLGLEKQL